MKLYLKPLLVILPVLAIFLYLVGRTTSPDAAKVPSRIVQITGMETEGLPLFSAVTWDSREMSLGDYAGKVVIVNFWASWCAPCIEELPSLIKLIEKYQGKIRLIAISGDSEKKDVEVFLKSFPGLLNPNVDLVWDEGHKIMEKFGVERLPESFVSRANHKLAKKISGSIDWFSPDAVDFMDKLLTDKD
jgi:cytochrome c biogenesis protein CcmG, thiol:disulfide interchange protein DsbE